MNEGLKWYEKAKSGGSTVANERIAALKESEVNQILTKGYNSLTESDYLKIFNLMPNNYSLKGNFGWLLIKKGKFAEAEKWILEAYEIDPDSLALNLNLGHLMLFKKQNERAYKYYQKAIDLISDEEEFSSSVEADFKIFIKNGWHVNECHKALEWMRKRFKNKGIPDWLLNSFSEGE